MPLPFVVCRAFVLIRELQRKSKGALGAGILHSALRNHGEAGRVAEGLQGLRSPALPWSLLLQVAQLQLLQLRPRRKLALEPQAAARRPRKLPATRGSAK